MEDYCLIQMVWEPNREGTLLDLLFLNREGLVGDRTGDCLVHNAHRALSCWRRVSRTATLDFQQVGFGLIWRLVESPLGGSPEEQRSPSRLNTVQERSLKSAGKGCPYVLKDELAGKKAGLAT